MDFRQTPQAATPRVAPATGPAAHEHKEPKDSKPSRGATSRWLQIFQLVVLVGVAVLLLAIALVFTRGNSSNESKFVDKSKYQAVFLNNGQVYFGNVTSLNDKYVRIHNVYYLTQASSTDTSSANNYSLVKLGCQQIHDPTDQMVINRDQVTFWENLQDNGKVVSSITQFKKQNPNGPDCSQPSSQTQASSNSSQSSQNSAATGTGSNSNASNK